VFTSIAVPVSAVGVYFAWKHLKERQEVWHFYPTVLWSANQCCRIKIILSWRHFHRALPHRRITLLPPLPFSYILPHRDNPQKLPRPFRRAHSCRWSPLVPQRMFYRTLPCQQNLLLLLEPPLRPSAVQRHLRLPTLVRTMTVMPPRRSHLRRLSETIWWHHRLLVGLRSFPTHLSATFCRSAPQLANIPLPRTSKRLVNPPTEVVSNESGGIWLTYFVSIFGYTYGVCHSLDVVLVVLAF